MVLYFTNIMGLKFDSLASIQCLWDECSTLHQLFPRMNSDRFLLNLVSTFIRKNINHNPQNYSNSIKKLYKSMTFTDLPIVSIYLQLLETTPTNDITVSPNSKPGACHQMFQQKASDRRHPTRSTLAWHALRLPF